jgi:small-conductance mechanosensitive channel
MNDGGDDTRWLTYTELGQARGISTASATQLAFRRKWRHQGGNDGIVRVAVPADEARPQEGVVPDDGDDRDDDEGDIGRLVTALRTTVSTLREQLARETARADSAESAQYALSVQLGHAETARTKAEVEITALRVRLTKARAEAQQAAQTAVELRQADAARRGLGVLARIRAAVRRV